MAIVHIPEAEAAKDFGAILAKVRIGQEVRIDSGGDSFALVPANRIETVSRRLSDIILALDEGRSTVTLPEGFAEDVEDGIRAHRHERLIDPWESF